MSTVTNSINDPNFKAFDYDFSKIFISGTKTDMATFKNNTGGNAAFSPGTLLARDSSDNSLVPLLSTNNTNGANTPVGVLMSEITELADAATSVNATFAIEGRVSSDKIIFQGADTYTTVIAEENNRTIGDLMRATGIIPQGVDDLTTFDNPSNP